MLFKIYTLRVYCTKREIFWPCPCVVLASYRYGQEMRLSKLSSSVICILLRYNICASQILVVKNLPTVQESQVQSLGQEDALEKEMAAHSSLLAWESLQTEEPGGLQFMGSLREEHDLATDEQHRQGIIAPFSSIGILSFLNDLVFFPPILQVIQLSLNSCFFFFAKILKRVFAS